jgi:S1-C subfamily serine protease
MVASLKPGATVTLDVWRNGAEKQLSGKVGALEDKAEVATADKAERGKARLGVAVRPLSPEEKQASELASGVVVEDVAGAAAKAGVRSGDVIVSVNNTPVKTVEQLKELIAKSGKTSGLSCCAKTPVSSSRSRWGKPLQAIAHKTLLVAPLSPDGASFLARSRFSSSALFFCLRRCLDME